MESRNFLLVPYMSIANLQTMNFTIYVFGRATIIGHLETEFNSLINCPFSCLFSSCPALPSAQGTFHVAPPSHASSLKTSLIVLGGTALIMRLWTKAIICPNERLKQVCYLLLVTE